MWLSILAIALLHPATRSVAEAQKKTAEPPFAGLTFNDSPKSWVMTLLMTTESGSAYELSIDLDTKKQGNVFRDDTQRDLIRANWVAETYGGRSIAIYGVRARDGNVDAVKSLVLTNRVRRGPGEPPHMAKDSTAKVETKTGEMEDKPDSEARKRPTGPQFEDEPFVEFDFQTLPPPPGVKASYELRVDTSGSVFKSPTSGDIHYSDDTAIGWEQSLNEIGYKAEVIEKSKLRVYGHVTSKGFLQATKGSITSEGLPKEQIPKVVQPKIRS